MRQHPIPHNILDIEFKLFGKFSVKQFGYIAVGAVTGGIFLLLRSNGAIPDIIAWPGFFIFAGLGAFLGVVPINDQSADTILTNFFNAINRPTRRVWRNAQFNQKLEVISKERELTVTRGTMSRNQQTEKQAAIVGSGPAADNSAQFATTEVIEELDAQEKARLDEIARIASTVGSTPTPAQSSTQTPQQQVIQKQPEPQSVSQTVQPQTGQQELGQQPVAQQSVGQNEVNSPQNGSQDNMQQQNTQTQNSSRNMQTTNLPSSITVTADTATGLPPASVTVSPQPNIPYVQFINNQNQPIGQQLVLIKNSNGVVVQAHQTNNNGMIVPTKPLSQGNYIVELQSDAYNLPSINFVAQDKEVKPVQVRSID